MIAPHQPIELSLGAATLSFLSHISATYIGQVMRVGLMKIFVTPPEVFVQLDVVDFRKSINGLVGTVEDELEHNAYTGALFVFCNKASDKLKITYWDKTGFALWYKRLEKQKFKWRVKYQTKCLN